MASLDPLSRAAVLCTFRVLLHVERPARPVYMATINHYNNGSAGSRTLSMCLDLSAIYILT